MAQAALVFEAKLSVLCARIAKTCIFGRRLRRHAELLIGPCAQVNIAAALAAEGAKPVAGRKNAGALAGGAFHNGGCWVVSAHGVDVSQLKNSGWPRKRAAICGSWFVHGVATIGLCIRHTK